MAKGAKRRGAKKGVKRAMSRTTVEKIARQVSYKSIPKKLIYSLGTDTSTQTNNNPWLMVQPTLIDQGSQNNMRNGDQIYVEKCRGFFNLSFSTSTLNRVEVRELVGFYKGSTNQQDKNIANFDISDLHTWLPNKMSSWDRDNFMITHDKSYDLTPSHIYEVSPGQPQAIWRSKRIALTQYLYRKYRYTNTTLGGNGNVVEGSLASSNFVMGWKPFIAIQVRCPDQDFTGSTGSNPGPYVDYKFITEFKDLQ